MRPGDDAWGGFCLALFGWALLIYLSTGGWTWWCMVPLLIVPAVGLLAAFYTLGKWINDRIDANHAARAEVRRLVEQERKLLIMRANLQHACLWDGALDNKAEMMDYGVYGAYKPARLEWPKEIA